MRIAGTRLDAQDVSRFSNPIFDIVEVLDYFAKKPLFRFEK